MPLSSREIVEFFHLVFARALGAQGDVKALIALKGGCNLRFYFGSVRYSEDIDFDVVVIAKDTLKKRVDRLLQAPTVVAPLKAQRVEITDVSAPKQTETTQRWKIGLKSASSAAPLRTKIEFSRRDTVTGTAFEAVDAAILQRYSIPVFLTTHYPTQVAAAQKIHALAGRPEPQARDVFDLALLLARADAADLQLNDAHKSRLEHAISNAMSISFDDYVAQVVAYLDPSQAELYASRSTWDAMQESIVNRLEALR